MKNLSKWMVSLFLLFSMAHSVPLFADESKVTQALQEEVSKFITKNGKASRDEAQARAKVFQQEMAKTGKQATMNPAEAMRAALKAARKKLDPK